LVIPGSSCVEGSLFSGPLANKSNAQDRLVGSDYRAIKIEKFDGLQACHVGA
jgi:hypothetical protein